MSLYIFTVTDCHKQDRFFSSVDDFIKFCHLLPCVFPLWDFNWKYENRWMKMYLQVCSFPHSLFHFLVSQSHVIIDHTAHCIASGCWAFHRASVHTPWPPIEPLKMPRALQKTRGSIWVCTCLSIFVTTCLVYALVLIKNKNTLEQYLWCLSRYWPKYQKRLHCSS